MENPDSSGERVENAIQERELEKRRGGREWP